ncbi:MAG: hypothetical protein Q8N63_09130 [Nanoarchaeota archaeon]|nr:hypothetical protein [Nanoarchaeota archaeon]
MGKKLGNYIRGGLAGILLGAEALTFSGCSGAFHEVFRDNERKNMEQFPDSVELDYSKYDKEKKHTVVVNDRAYRTSDLQPPKILEEIIEIPPGKVQRIPALGDTTFIEDANGEVILNYKSRIPAPDLQKRIAPFFENMIITPYSNSLIFSGKKQVFGNFEDLTNKLNFLDTTNEQIRVAVTVIEYFRDNTYDREWNIDMLKDAVKVFSLNLPSQPDPAKTLMTGISINPVYNYKSHDSSVLSALKFLNSHGRAKVASYADTIMPNGETADISNKASVPYEELLEGKTGLSIRTYKYRETGTAVKVTAHANEEGYISVKLDIETGEQTGFVGKEQVPVFKTSICKTTIELMNGETDVAAISSSDRYKEVKRGLPLIDILPILKDIFSSKELEKSKSEQIYVVTARVLGREDDIEFRINNGDIFQGNSSHNLHRKNSESEISEEPEPSLLIK